MRTIARFMSSQLPDQVDAWRMVATGRVFEGDLALSTLPRLASLLAEPTAQDTVHCMVSFGKDGFGVANAEIEVNGSLPLVCQRTLQRFGLAVAITQQVALIGDEAEEAALPPGYEAWLVGEGGMVSVRELVEDELILAVPAIPVAPGTEAMEADWLPSEEETTQANPFAALAALKNSH